MKIEDQIISLELAKKLKEVGIGQESLFYWADGLIISSICFDILCKNKIRSFSAVYNSHPDQDIFNIYSAFTVAELGKILQEHPKLRMGYVEVIYSEYFSFNEFNNMYSVKSYNEANCRAMWILHLLGVK